MQLPAGPNLSPNYKLSKISDHGAQILELKERNFKILYQNPSKDQNHIV